MCTPTTVRTNVSNTNQWFINIFLPEFLVFILYMPPSLKPVVLIYMPHHPTPFFLFHSLLVSTATASPLQGLPQTAASIHVPSSIIIHRNWGSEPSWWIIIIRTCFGPVCYLQFVTMTGSFACFLLLLFFFTLGTVPNATNKRVCIFSQIQTRDLLLVRLMCLTPNANLQSTVTPACMLG